MKRVMGLFSLIMGLGLWLVFGQENREMATFADGVLTVGDITYEFAKVPAGKFQMGSENRYNNEKPVHTVKLSGFYIA